MTMRFALVKLSNIFFAIGKELGAKAVFDSITWGLSFVAEPVGVSDVIKIFIVKLLIGGFADFVFDFAEYEISFIGVVKEMFEGGLRIGIRWSS